MIERHEGKNQVCCDHCPASYPNTYLQEDFAVMIADTKTAGWAIRKAKPPADKGETGELFGNPRPELVEGAMLERHPSENDQPYTHSCPDCVAREQVEGRLL